MSEETKKIPFKDTMAGPTVVLLLICLVVSGALALVYQVTAPTIEKINAKIELQLMLNTYNSKKGTK